MAGENINIDALQNQCSQWAAALSLEETVAAQLERCCIASNAVFEWLRSDPSLLPTMFSEALLFDSFDKAQIGTNLLPQNHLTLSEPAFMSALRRCRKLAMIRFIWREVNQLCSIEQSMAEISYFAEVILDATLVWAEQHLAPSFGHPYSETSGLLQRLCILGMGKLGGLELNLSSDIDLIFVYPEAGETQGGRRSLANHDYFIRLSRKLIGLLDTVNAEGFVFRVDMRLRPYGGAGALAANFDAMQIYYQEQGREWERYALIKARPVAGDIDAGNHLITLLKPFVYRKYVDYSVIDALRELKRSIHAEVTRKNMQQHLKLGSGGIREVEFIVQVFQLIYGGQFADLRRRSLLAVLPSLAEMAYLDEATVEELRAAYLFLRRAEHAVMMFTDAQSHELPTNDVAKQALLTALGFDTWQCFDAELQQHRQKVRHHFDAVVAMPETDDTADADSLWPLASNQQRSEQLALEMGFDRPAILVQKLLFLDGSSRYQALDIVARTRVNDLLPLLLQEIAAYDSASDLAVNVLHLIDAILRRSAYMVLLLENVAARKLLVRLMHASSWVSSEIIAYPVLLDELVQTESLYHLPDAGELHQQLALLTARESEGDLEQHMDILRRFKRSHMLRIAVAEISQALPLMKVSDYLSLLATTILQHALLIAYHNLVARHGMPEACDAAIARCGFAVIAYGKLGGLELSHRSDLDMVFIYSPAMQSETSGASPISAQQFYTRLAQRLIHILSTPTAAGRLYEVDMRLRPSGKSGAVVSSVPAYLKYQQESAWTWEHQALVRARAIVGDTRTISAFESCRIDILSAQRNPKAVAKDVIAMRGKMLDNLLPSAAKGASASQFELKHSRGGIVDIEFMVQFAVLAYASQYPELAAFPDNIRTLETLERTGLLSPVQVNQLISAYKAYRSAVHALSLQDKPALLPLERFVEERANVSLIWEQLFYFGE